MTLPTPAELDRLAELTLAHESRVELPPPISYVEIRALLASAREALELKERIRELEQRLHERGIELGHANSRLQKHEQLATNILQHCNEASRCPFCGVSDGEHEVDGYHCSALDELLNGSP